MRGLSLVLASHSFAILVNLQLFSYKFAIFLCKFAIFFHTNSPLFSFSSFLRSLIKARLISPNLPILMRCFCRLRTKFLTKFLHHRDKLLPITSTNFQLQRQFFPLNFPAKFLRKHNETAIKIVRIFHQISSYQDTKLSNFYPQHPRRAIVSQLISDFVAPKPTIQPPILANRYTKQQRKFEQKLTNQNDKAKFGDAILLVILAYLN